MKPSPTPSESLPGITPFSDSLLVSFEEMRKLKGADYQPRTRHFASSGQASYTNRLFLESSPYLQQHAHNPVNWYPWGEEAFAAAKKLNRPVLVSIGYSTCHWCHIMEEESFENIEIAHYLNTNYVAIKVDREERPDIDAIYMSAVQAMTGSGGWPLNVCLTSDQKPFWGGTYFPAKDGDRGAAVGFLTVIKRIIQAFSNNREKIEQSGQQLTKHIRSSLTPADADSYPGSNIIRKALQIYRQQFDTQYGGLNQAPKFPSTLPTGLLLRAYRRLGEADLLDMVSLSLEKMADGGMYDQVAGGFHRYSTDMQWLVPHFEKMLYDNALLAVSYLEAFQVIKNPRFKKIVNEILQYVEREMISPESLFYSATDADSITSEGSREEGYYFTWTPEELDQALGKERSVLVKAYYNVKPGGNFEGRSILHLREKPADIAKQYHLTESELEEDIRSAREVLLKVRNNRNMPIRDDKILTAWNGLMISAFAKAGFVLNQPDYIQTAEAAAEAILLNLSKEGRLFRTFKDGRAKFNGFLDDYAFFIAALLDLYEASFDSRWLQKAIELDKILAKDFEDMEKGGFFMTASSSEKLIAREKPCYDGALPSENAVALLNLQRLEGFTGEKSYGLRFQKALRLFLGNPAVNPIAQAEMLKALDYSLDKPKEIVLIISENKKQGV